VKYTSSGLRMTLVRRPLLFLRAVVEEINITASNLVSSFP
jgi:hypothetical protein